MLDKKISLLSQTAIDISWTYKKLVWLIIAKNVQKFHFNNKIFISSHTGIVNVTWL